VELAILSVNVARPRVIAYANGEPVLSAIAKTPPIGQNAVFVGTMNISGDEQADLSVHGGFDKAVYAYPTDHWSWWEKEKGLSCKPGSFGENLTLEGADESDVAIGDQFRWGDAILEIAQPRGPCFKLGIHTGRPDVPQAMTLSGRCGWYLRVLHEGHAPVSNTHFVRVAANGGPSVREAFLAVVDPRASEDLRRRIFAAPGLAESWRHAVAKRLSGRR